MSRIVTLVFALLLCATQVMAQETPCTPVAERAMQIDQDPAIQQAFIHAHISDPARFGEILETHGITPSYFSDLDAEHEASGTRDSARIFQGYLQDLADSGLLDGQPLDVNTPDGRTVRVPDAALWLQNSILPGTQGLAERLLKVCQAAKRSESALIAQLEGNPGAPAPETPEETQEPQAAPGENDDQMMSMMTMSVGGAVAMASLAYMIFPAAMPFTAAAEINNHGDFLLGIRQPLGKRHSLLLYQDYRNEFSGVRWEMRW